VSVPWYWILFPQPFWQHEIEFRAQIKAEICMGEVADMLLFQNESKET
jgi:hypothetical protein